MKTLVLALAVLASGFAFAESATTGYENRPLPTVSADLTTPPAPAKSATCVVPEKHSWAEVSVSRLALEAQGTCGAPMKTTAESESAPALKR